MSPGVTPNPPDRSSPDQPVRLVSFIAVGVKQTYGMVSFRLSMPSPDCDGKSSIQRQLFNTRSHPEMVGDMSLVTLIYDLSKIPSVHF